MEGYYSNYVSPLPRKAATLDCRKKKGRNPTPLPSRAAISPSPSCAAVSPSPSHTWKDASRRDLALAIACRRHWPNLAVARRRRWPNLACAQHWGTVVAAVEEKCLALAAGVAAVSENGEERRESGQIEEVEKTCDNILLQFNQSFLY